ncbi:bZIP transcription factor 11-like [Abrus precatorius]|uniref:BZIP transcription factor 11-like n=1 Tax=Abrus precatorius TaxID=3816 RepID=A0A8B8KSR1_ABRPR|nr:bZIP transcription factor 11-like [Abrus precatorius]
MSPVICEILRSGFTINSTLRRRTHLVQSFSVVFLYCITYIHIYSMASPRGAYSSGSSSLQNSPSGSEGDIMEQRKRKRMLSNRESARRSRMRKQQHLEGLSAQVDELKKENTQISTSIGITTQLYLKVEGENAILRVQMAELSNRLQSLNEIINFINSSNYLLFDEAQETQFNDCAFMDAWNSLPINQPIMPQADMLMY